MSLSVVLALLGGCGEGGADDSGPGDATGSLAPVQALFDTHCVACHSGAEPTGGLDLEAGRSWAQLVDVDSLGSTLPRVAPGDLDGSYLWLKVHGRQGEVEGTGTPMPPNYLLTAAELAPVEAWILAGAPDS